jgi:hypothetical protein
LPNGGFRASADAGGAQVSEALRDDPGEAQRKEDVT